MYVLCMLALYLPLSVATTDKYDILPPVYEMDDYITCMDRNDTYCKADIILRNNGCENNTLWSLINESRMDKYSIDRSIIHRGVCVPETEAGDIESIRIFVEKHVNEEVNQSNLISSVEDVTCVEMGYNISPYDIFVLVLFVAYISLIFFATIYEKRKKMDDAKSRSTGEKMLISLSLISNWKKLCKTDGDEDFKRLKSMQGIRFYSMISIIYLHSKLSYIFVYLSNPEITGLFLSSPLTVNLSPLGALLVQTFFMISSWIVVFQIYNIYNDYGKFTAKQAFCLCINRYFRLAVCSTVMILVLQSPWIKLFDGPLTFDNRDLFQKTCRRNWWQTFFFVNNHLYFGDECHPTTWYLSVDFQLYIVAIMTMYIILKFKLNDWKCISFLLVLSYITHGLVIYFYETDVFIVLTASLLRRYTFFRSDVIRILYTSTYSCWPTSVVGMLLGIIYLKYKNQNVAENNIVSRLCLLLPFILPPLALLIGGMKFKGVVAAILGPLVKPLYTLGIGIAILGMSHNIGGILKRVCENKYVLLMSNFSFSVYVFQTLIIFTKGVGSYSMVEFQTSKETKSFLFFDAPLSIIVGVIGALIFEQPGINLQKILLPQVSRRKQRKD